MTSLDEVFVVHILERGMTGDGFSPAEAAQMRTDMDTFLGTTIPQEIGDLNDVDLTGLGDGDVLRYDADTGEWLAAEASPAVATVDSASIDFTTSTGSIIDGGPIFTIVTGDVKYGGTGSAATAARSDHSHTATVISDVQTFAATGALSSGTRTLITYDAGPLLDGVVYDCRARVVVNMRNDGDTGIVNLGLRIGGSGSFPKTTTEVRTVGGVDRLAEWVFVRSAANGGQIVGTNATVQVVADVAFSSGDPTNIRHGWVEFEAHPRR